MGMSSLDDPHAVIITCRVQVCQRLRKLVHTHLATTLSLRQPHLTPHRQPTLDSCLFAQLTAVTKLDLSHCLDWVQHPCLCNLIDINKLTAMTQLCCLNLRPPSDQIDSFEAGRVKLNSGALCWSDGIMPRLWDRWMYALSPGIPTVNNKTALAALTALETLHFPLTIRSSEQRNRRARTILPLPLLRSLSLGSATILDSELGQFLSSATLTRLSLGNCCDVTDAGLANIAAMKNLQVLLLHGCAQIKVNGRWELLQQLTVLHTLALHGRPEGENVHFFNVVDSAAQSVAISGNGAHHGRCHRAWTCIALAQCFSAPCHSLSSSNRSDLTRQYSLFTMSSHTALIPALAACDSYAAAPNF
jgi:hypothetical protein